MFQVFSTITDDLGTRVIPTGDGAYDRDTAEDILERYSRKYPQHRFHVDWAPGEDWDLAI